MLEAGIGVEQTLPACGGCGQEIVVSWDGKELKSECGGIDDGACCHFYVEDCLADRARGYGVNHEHSAELTELAFATHRYASALVGMDPQRIARLKREHAAREEAYRAWRRKQDEERRRET